MKMKARIAVAAIAACSVGGSGFALADSATAAVPPAPHATNCTLAQLRVNLISAELTAAKDRLALGEAVLAHATANNKTMRIQMIGARIAKIQGRIAKRTQRLQAIEAACSVQATA